MTTGASEPASRAPVELEISVEQNHLTRHQVRMEAFCGIGLDRLIVSTMFDLWGPGESNQGASYLAPWGSRQIRVQATAHS